MKLAEHKWLPQLAALLKACADQTRLRLLNLLAQEGEVCVCHLVDVLGTNQPKVSRHLAYLKRAGLVSDRKDGLWVHYRLAAPLAESAARLLECLNSCCAELPEMQSDVAKLRQVQCAQPIVKLTRRPPRPPAVAPAEPQQPTVTTVARAPEAELQVELL